MMQAQTRARAAWIIFGLALSLTLVGVWLNILNAHETAGVFSPNFLLIPTFGVVGAVVTARTGHRIGWLFLGVGLLGAITSFTFAYAVRSATGSSSLPAAPEFAAFSNIGFPMTFLALGILLLVFPTGTLPSPRWRWLVWAFGLCWGVMAFAALTDVRIELGDTLTVPNPFAVAIFGHLPFLPFRRSLATQIWTVAGALALAATATAPFFRWRSAKAEARQQLKWLASVTIAAIVTGVLVPLVPPKVGGWLSIAALLLVIAGIPIAVGVAVLKYRLYDLDVVIKKTLVFGLLAVFISGVYALVVGGIGWLVKTTSNTLLSFAAAAVLAIAFQPARDRARRLADRLVFGRRATPYEVLAQFSDRMSGTYATDDVLPRMAEILASGTGASRATVWLRVGGELRPAASTGEIDATSLPITADELPAFPQDDYPVEVRHQGDLLGALSVAMPPSDPINPAKEKLVRDLAAQASLVLRNVRLIEELRASRQRLVAAQDEERRRIERDLHDGAQQQLVALSVKLRLAEQLSERDPEGARLMVSGLQTDTNEALENLRDLARGIYPPLLADRGIAAALEAQARKSAVPTTVESTDVDRYAPEVEATIYFCTLEALQNVAKYAAATRAEIRLGRKDGHVTFEIEDDGAGFDARTTGSGTGLRGMADRLDAIGGSLEVRSAPGRGTTIVGRVPATARVGTP